LAATLQHYFPGLRPWLVLAVLSDKDIRAVLKQLLPTAKGALFSRSRHPRAADPRQLQEAAGRVPTPTELIPDLHAATVRAIELAGPDGLVVAAGSFTTAGEVRQAWLRLHDSPLPAIDPI
jgi:dihydrofolate synthase/folylpolyglutamate synthase